MFFDDILDYNLLYHIFVHSNLPICHKRSHLAKCPLGGFVYDQIVTFRSASTDEIVRSFQYRSVLGKKVCYVAYL